MNIFEMNFIFLLFQLLVSCHALPSGHKSRTYSHSFSHVGHYQPHDRTQSPRRCLVPYVPKSKASVESFRLAKQEAEKAKVTPPASRLGNGLRRANSDTYFRFNNGRTSLNLGHEGMEFKSPQRSFSLKDGVIYHQNHIKCTAMSIDLNCLALKRSSTAGSDRTAHSLSRAEKPWPRLQGWTDSSRARHKGLIDRFRPTPATNHTSVSDYHQAASGNIVQRPENKESRLNGSKKLIEPQQQSGLQNVQRENHMRGRYLYTGHNQTSGERKPYAMPGGIRTPPWAQVDLSKYRYPAKTPMAELPGDYPSSKRPSTVDYSSPVPSSPSTPDGPNVQPGTLLASARPGPLQPDHPIPNPYDGVHKGPQTFSEMGDINMNRRPPPKQGMLDRAADKLRTLRRKPNFSKSRDQ